MEFGSQHGRKQTRRMTEFEDGKRLLPKPKPSVELPFDVIVSILTRIPARHLRRMMSVCWSWISLISDSRFIREYSKFQTTVTKRPYIISLDRVQNSYKMKFFPECDEYHHEFDVSRYLVGSPFCIMSNSCDGLICVVGDTFTYLVNPSIQKVRALPKTWHFNFPSIHSAGMGFNDFTGEYKVVRFFHRKVGQHWHLECEVYTIGNLHSASDGKAIDNPLFKPSRRILPVFVNGALHWTVRKGKGPEIALSFDIKSEKFDVILHPEGSSRPPCSQVVELGGLLCVACAHHDRMQMDIWGLKDYNNREWIKHRWTYEV